jgi:hypothetical protein
MKVEWNMDDLKLQRFSSEGLKHHFEYTGKVGRERMSNKEVETLRNEILSQKKVKVITPFA